ncbi:MAG: hypothetical protein ACOYEW_04690, partial [Anaerolineae bacterium]
PRPTTPVMVPDDSSGTGGMIMEMVAGILSEVLEATGISDMFRGVGSAVLNGALVAVGAFAVIGVLALVRQLVLMLYHSMVRR